MDTVFIVVGASNVIAFIIRDLGQPAIVGWVIQVSHTQSNAQIFTDSMFLGPSTCTSCSRPAGWSAIRCLGQTISRIIATHYCIHWSRDLRKGSEYVGSNRWWHFDWDYAGNCWGYTSNSFRSAPHEISTVSKRVHIRYWIHWRIVSLNLLVIALELTVS